MYDTTVRSSSPNTTIGSPVSVLPGQTPTEEFRVEHPIGMNLMLISGNGGLQNFYLPYPPKGRYSLGTEIPAFLEAAGGSWLLRGAGENSSSDGVRLCSPCMLPVRGTDGDYMLYAEEVSRESFAYHNYIVLTSVEIRIGRARDNDIVCPGTMISRYHASLIFDGRKWRIRDVGSANGVFVNGKKIQACELRVGDVISILGLRMIIGSGFLSVNDGSQRYDISAEKLLRVNETKEVLSFVLPDPFRKRPGMFNRFPRHRLALEEKEISIEQPPMAMSGDGMPLLMRSGNSLVMGGTAALTGNVAMLATSLLLPVLSRQYTKEEKEEYEKKRLKKYREYLDNKWQEILDEKSQEETVLNTNYPPFSEVLSYVGIRENPGEKLWERRKTDDDFLLLRIGSGSVPMKAKLSCAKRRFELESDALQDEMYALTEKEIILEQVPILQDLRNDTVWGVSGDRAMALQFARIMVMRLSLLYSYDELKIVFLAEPEDLRRMEFVRFLPHLWDDQRNIRFLASDIPETGQIGEHIAKSLGEDLEKPGRFSDMMKRHPYYVVFALSRRLFDSMEMLKTAMQQDENCGVSIIAVFDDVPKECSILLKMTAKNEGTVPAEHTVVYLKQPDKKEEHFILDDFDGKTAAFAMREMADIRLRLVSQAYALPRTLTFLEMLGVGRIEHLDIAKNWRENNPVKSLAVPVGIGTDGTTIMLDLHQKYQGPHGLVAGTTGSGKSEFLLTYILSLAINFHPDEVAFVLIDYKGGGLAGAFDDPANGIHLPHLIATITNLDGSAISRSLTSIQSEMTRRQRVFNEAKSASGEGTMDIYTYQRLYRNKVVPEAMPHLFIISDEFAELKQQQPEFLEQLVSIARIGRSLGVHLILATQKPAGVVTDQIVSNTKFRVCLKVQDRSDSMDMLKRPEASELKETGRFYLQVGNNELFVLGQSGWSGAEYEPQDQVSAKRDESIQVIDDAGQGILEIKPEEKKQSTGKSQLVMIVKAITDLAQEMGIPQRSLWLPALKKRLDVEQLEKQGGHVPETADGPLTVCCGLLDDPAAQKQHLLTLNLEKCGHILVTGEPGSGKTTFIQTLLYSLASNYSSQRVNFYILDYSSRLLRLFGNLPHCGAVLAEEQEEALNLFFRLIMQIAQERKALFSELEVDSYEAANRLHPLPLILVVIDNFAGLKTSRTGQAHAEKLPEYIKSCGNFGIRFVVTLSYLNEAPTRVKQELTERIVLHMKDKYDYSDALGIRAGYLPPDQPGRGLYLYQGQPMEMQLAMFAPEKKDQERIALLKQRVDELRLRCGTDHLARVLPIISKEETYESFVRQFQPGRIPLGYFLKDSTPTALPLKQFSMLSLYFGNPESTVPVLDNFLCAAEREKMEVYFLKKRQDSVLDRLPHGGRAQIFEADTAGIETLYQSVIGELRERHAIFQAYCDEKHLDSDKEDIYLDVYSYMHETVTPLLVIMERYADLCAATEETDGLLRKYSSIYLLARRYQVYIIGCFYPDENQLLVGNKLFGCFNKEKLCMLFGGSLSRQMLVQVPRSAGSAEKPSDYNQCLMNYRGELYPMLMPCGPKQQVDLSEDDRPIFTQ